MQQHVSTVDIKVTRRAAAKFLSIAIAAGVSGILTTLLTSHAQAQTWPQRNVRVILPFGAGSATDFAARLLSDRLSTKWGKPVVIENRPGGDGLRGNHGLHLRRR